MTKPPNDGVLPPLMQARPTPLDACGGDAEHGLHCQEALVPFCRLPTHRGAHYS